MLALALVSAIAAPSPAQADTNPTTACLRLQGRPIPASAIGLPTTGGDVTAAVLIPSTGLGATSIPEYCRVNASIHPVDPSAPDIHLTIGLPTSWNHKAMMFGGGGYDGSIPAIDGDVPFGNTNNSVKPLGRGYATFASDSGHQGTSSLDGSFAVNDEALHNFTGDALKKTHDVALYLIGKRYRGATPDRAYFAGGSSGGREALEVTQRWPTDFNGVIAVYPAWNAASLDLFFGYEAKVFSRPGAFPDVAKQTLLYNAVMNTCDGLDGVRDGVISNQASCHFNPHVLRCPGGGDRGDSCLSDTQIDAIVAMSSPLNWDYPVASGETGYPGFPFLSGADMRPPRLGMGTEAPANPMPKDSGYGVQFWEQWVRYFITRDPNYNSLAIDPQQPGPWQQRISDLTALQDVNNPNLRAFAKAGGKLLILHGTADELVSSRSTVDYFNRVQTTMGKPATHAFARLYLVPGANHANIGAAFAAGWDSLSALERWSERGQAPANPMVTDTNSAAGRTRPLCENPAWPKYNGLGDPDLASSFTCTTGT